MPHVMHMSHAMHAPVRTQVNRSGLKAAARYGFRPYYCMAHSARTPAEQTEDRPAAHTCKPRLAQGCTTGRRRR